MRMHAVLVGIDEYKDRNIRRLSYARNDAERFERCLASSTLYRDINLHTLLDAEATRDNIVRTIGTDLPRVVQKGDVVLVYFACHGAPEIVKANVIARYLVCHDTDYSSLISSSLDVELDLQRLAARIPASLIVFITDACYSGYTGGRGIIGPTLADQRARQRSGLRLSDLRLGEGTIFWGAASDDEVAWEPSSLKHGVFSHFLIDELTERTNGDSLGISTLYDRVHAKVYSYTRSRQNPVLFGAVRGARLPILIER